MIIRNNKFNPISILKRIHFTPFNLYYKFLLVILLSAFFSPMFAEVSCPRTENPEIEIRDFFIKDFTLKTYIVQTKARDEKVLHNNIVIEDNASEQQGTQESESNSKDKKEDEDIEKFVKKPKFKVFVNDIPMDNINRSYNKVKLKTTRLEWEIKPSRDIDFQDACISLRSSSGLVLDQFPYTIPNSMKEPGQQPLVLDIQPRGGAIEDTLTMKVENPGKDLDKIVIFILKPGAEQEGYAYNDKEACILFPFYISEEKTLANKQRYHEVKFILSHYLEDSCGFKMSEYKVYEKMFGKEIQLKLSVNARPSKIEKITLLSSSWKGFAISMGLMITIIFMLLLAFFSKKINFFPDIFLDPETNSYSLANFQSFAWTIVLMGSYFYIAVCQGLILGNPELPDFNFSLIALLGVSYGGMIASNYVDKRKKHLIIRKDKPELRDLIFDPNGGIDMARMQLFGFNLICLLLYIYYLLKANPLNGLPSIPETLHSLLGTSQAGYIGSQAVTQMVSGKSGSTETVAKEEVEAVETKEEEIVVEEKAEKKSKKK